MMDKQPFTCVLVSDFNLQNFAGYVANDPEFPGIQPITAPFGQPVATLLNRELACWQNEPDVAVIWTRPQSVVPAFQALLFYEQVPLQKVLQQVDEYCSLLVNMSERVKYAFVPSWVLASYRSVFGVLDMQTEIGLTNTIMRMNLRLVENLSKAANIYVLNVQHWIAQAGVQAFSPKLWYLGKIPFGNEVFKAAARDIKAALRGMLGYARKLIIVDLDDTLWGGIVGDTGWENLALGGHHHIGEAFADFQHALKSMQNRGILLAIVSKNEEQIALEAIEKHPEMVLKLEDFAGWRINWQDKAQNIIDLLTELNLGPQSAVFIDDNPAERARIKESLPEVLVPDWPEDPLFYPATLLSLRCFELPSLSGEDLVRTTMYLSENKRRELKKTVSSLEEWLSRLAIRVRVEELHPANLQRATQLLNKTNQMNLSTRRMSEAEFMAWAEQEHHRLWTLRVSDKFGDAGLTGIVSLEIQEQSAQIVDFILSCRVLGRKIEETMLAIAIQHAQALGIENVFARYIPTAKNKPCLDFFTSLAPEFQQQGDCFVRCGKQPFPVPEHIEIITNQQSLATNF
ncbi:MAG: HAD-IIIC family phosphatase [Desulfobacterales bacterium]|nr:MAG: HAD-IIIC family phosphatase [Desulfobacterales bacterium]